MDDAEFERLYGPWDPFDPAEAQEFLADFPGPWWVVGGWAVESDVSEFVDAVRRVADGGSAIDPQIVSELLSRQRTDDPLDELTPREREVLELMASGRSNSGIAESLVISVGAVEKYVSSIFGKLGLPSTGAESRRVLAVLLFLSG